MPEYPHQITIDHLREKVSAVIDLNRSKSISNRVQIIKALCEEDFEIKNLSDSDDSQLLKSLLSQQSPDEYDAHHAGTTYRFLCSYLATQPGQKVLTGSSRMKERPIGPLVEALTSLGADIQYLEKEGYPPLSIGAPPATWQEEVTLPADISSQYISSLMMIAPTLKNGLTIHLEGELVSRPYLEMTVRIMEYFGAEVTWADQSIIIKNTPYTARPFDVEADWSAASYYYSIAALSPMGSSIRLLGLYEDSLQGDSKIAEIMESFGVRTDYEVDGILITKDAEHKPFIEYDFIEQPDLAQTVIALCGALGVHGLFTGLKTLRIKETDRIHALQEELNKYGVFLSKVPPRFAKKAQKEYFMVEGTAEYNEEAIIETYRDHRMAMAMAPLAIKFPVKMNKPGVVSKSYPLFWEHLKSCGFSYFS
jgi:3-phosphoshikimate 1-carboxyvinyltransferase